MKKGIEWGTEEPQRKLKQGEQADWNKAISHNPARILAPNIFQSLQ